jgi:hypothetical protein
MPDDEASVPANGEGAAVNTEGAAATTVVVRTPRPLVSEATAVHLRLAVPVYIGAWVVFIGYLMWKGGQHAYTGCQVAQQQSPSLQSCSGHEALEVIGAIILLGGVTLFLIGVVHVFLVGALRPRSPLCQPPVRRFALANH